MQSIETRHIKYFIAVAEELHFRRAAERLNLAQPSLSRAVQQLEHTVGVKLFNRTNRRVELTVAGTVFLEQCRRSLEALESAAHLARKADAGEVGHLTFGYTDFAISGILPQILEQFRRRFPDVSIDLLHLFTEQQIGALKQKTIDFGFMTGPVMVPGLSHFTVQRDRMVVILPETHPLAELDVVPLAALAEEPFVAGMARWWSHYMRHLENVCQEEGFRPNIVQEAFNSEGIFGLVAAKMGIAIHPECARNYIRKGIAVRDLATTYPRIPTEVTWVSGPETPLMKNFVRFLREDCADTESQTSN